MTLSERRGASPLGTGGDGSHDAIMKSCIDQAVENASEDGGPFAALLVFEGRIVARGQNRVTARLDPTAHAEVEAIRAAATALGRFNLAGCALFTSCEPCPMCLGAAYWARVDRVFYAATRFEAAGAGFDDMTLYNELCLPVSQRSLPLVQLSTAEARAPFDAWNRNSTKIRY